MNDSSMHEFEQPNPSQPPAPGMRQQARAVLHGQSVDVAALSENDIQALLHELRTYQAELDSQNEQLRDAQHELAASRNAYADLYEFAPVGYLTLADDGQIVAANLTAAQLLGVERQQLLHQPLNQFVQAEDQDTLFFHVRHLQQQYGPQECELRIIRPDGTRFYAHLQSRPVQHEGSSSRYRTAIFDITSRMQAEHGLRQAHAELEQRVQERTAALTRSNASLRENEARFRLVLQDSPITVFTQDRNLRYTWIYNAAPQFTHTHVLGKTDVEILPPDDATRFIELKQRVLDTGTGARQDVSVTIGGSQRWYHLKLEPLRASDSRVQGITGVATDITPYRRASEAQRLLAEVSSQLAASLDTVERLRQFVRLMTEELADLCIIHILAQSESTDNLMLFHTDPTSEEHIRAGIQGRAMYSEQHPLVAHVLHSGRLIHLRDIPERHQVSDAEADYLAQLRAWGALSYVGVPMVARNTVIGVLTLVRDRGERRYTLEDLPLIEELARRAALALDNIYLYEAEQRARRAAEQAADRTARLQRITASLVEGQSFDEIARVVVEQAVAALGACAGMIALLNKEGSHIEVIRTQGYGTGWQEQWQRFPIGDIPTPITTAMEQGAPIWLPSRAEFARRYPEFSQQADERSQAWAALPLLVEGHAVGGLGLSFASEQDFPRGDQAFIMLLVQQCAQALERARLYEAEYHAREEAEEAVRIRNQVFRLISHDLKAPLSAIQGYAYLLQRRFAALDIPEAERFTRGLGNIESTTRRMAVQIEELLDVAALQAGRGISLAFGPFDLTSLVQQVIDESQQISDDHEVVLDVPREHFELIGDEVRLQRVLTNLVTNAIKYSPQGGEVCLMIARQDVESIPGVAVAVHDQGIGIPADELPTIFEPFTRGSNTSQEISGTGLGLASAQQIVEQHGGRIIAQSQEGQGSTFTIWLPLEHTE